MVDLIQQANQYREMSMSNLSTSDRVKASRLGKKIVLAINEIYKRTQDPNLMDVMKQVTAKKRRIEQRLKGRPEL